MVGITYEYIDTMFAFYGNVDFLTHLYSLTGCLSIIVWTHAFFGVCHRLVFYVFVFALVQRSSACFTRKGTLEIP